MTISNPGQKEYDMLTAVGHPFRVSRQGWARFDCANCDQPLSPGDEAVMVGINLVQAHPAHVRCVPAP